MQRRTRYEAGTGAGLLVEGLTEEQANLIADVEHELKAPLMFGTLTPAEAAQALERLAFHLRVGGRERVFHLEGRFKPYVRMTQRGQWVSRDAQEYIASKAEIQRQIRAQLNGAAEPVLPESTPLALYVEAEYPRGWHGADLDNVCKCLADAAQAPHGPLYKNDQWIDYITAGRRRGDAERVTLAAGVVGEG
jgi:Holliday junction resolvase RusA-like endonuclease